MKSLQNGTCFGLFALLGIAAISCAEPGTFGDPDARMGNAEEERAVVCHVAGESPGSMNTIEIARSDVDDHLSHGDQPGPCPGQCIAAAHPCNGDGDCCGEDCQAGICALSCRANEEPCEMSGQCCSGNCEEGACAAHCKGFERLCDSGDECCSGNCILGRCAAL